MNNPHQFTAGFSGRRTWSEEQFQSALAAYLQGKTTLPRMRKEYGVPGVTFAVEAKRRNIQLRAKGYILKGKSQESHPSWKGGSWIDAEGYVWVFAPEHPWRRKSKYIREHIQAMELHLGRRLTATEVVHHRDHNKQNNSLENLELKQNAVHAREHRLEDNRQRNRDGQGRFI